MYIFFPRRGTTLLAFILSRYIENHKNQSRATWLCSIVPPLACPHCHGASYPHIRLPTSSCSSLCLCWPAHIIKGLRMPAVWLPASSWGTQCPCCAAHVIVDMRMPVFDCPHRHGTSYDRFDLPTSSWTCIHQRSTAHAVAGLPTLVFGCPCHCGTAYISLWLPASLWGVRCQFCRCRGGGELVWECRGWRGV